MVHEKIKLAISRLRADALATTADLLKWWFLMATDITVHLAFGESFHMVEKGEVSWKPISGLRKQLIGFPLAQRLHSRRPRRPHR
jgi:hypothetical protein